MTLTKQEAPLYSRRIQVKGFLQFPTQLNHQGSMGWDIHWSEKKRAFFDSLLHRY